MPEAERTLAVPLRARSHWRSCSGAARPLGCLIGLWAGISVVCLYALATRLFPEQLGVFDPIAGLPALRARRLLERARTACVASGCSSLSVWSPGRSTARSGCSPQRRPSRSALTLLLHVQPRRVVRAGRRASSSRSCSIRVGCSWRRSSAVIAPWPAFAVLVAARSGPLTEDGGHTLAAAAEDGRALAALGVGLALFAAGAAASSPRSSRGCAIAPRRAAGGEWRRGRRRRGVLVGGLCSRWEGRPAIARSFAADYPRRSQPDLDDRLFSLSGNGRVEAVARRA